MEAQALAEAATAARNSGRGGRPKRHQLEVNPPPPIKLCTAPQIEDANPALQGDVIDGVRKPGRLRDWIKRADAGDPDYAGLKFAIVRVGRSLYIDEIRFRDWLHRRTALPPAPARNDPGAE